MPGFDARPMAGGAILLQPNPQKWLSAKEAADALACSVDVVHDLIADGTLEAFKLKPNVRNSHWRVSAADVAKHTKKVTGSGRE